MNQYWIKLYRRIQDHWLWDDKPFSKGQAWIDLLILANSADKKAPYKGDLVMYERGTVNRSIAFLAGRWGWSRKKVNSFLKLLENDGMVTTKVTTHRTVITIENYGVYNDKGKTEGKTKVTTEEQQGNSQGTAKEQQVHTNKNEKNDRKTDIKKDTTNVVSKESPPLGEFQNVYLTEEELEKLKERFPHDWKERIENLSQYMKSKGKRYKSHYATILTWARKDEKQKAEQGGKRNSTAQQLDDFYAMAAEWAEGESDG